MREALVVMLQHRVVQAIETQSGHVLYQFNPDSVMWRLNIPKFALDH